MDEALEQQANFLDYLDIPEQEEEDVSEPIEDSDMFSYLDEDEAEMESFVQQDELQGDTFLKSLMEGEVDGYAMGDSAVELYSALGTTNVNKANTYLNRMGSSSTRDIIASRESKDWANPYQAVPRRKDGSLVSSAAGKYQFLWGEHAPWIMKQTGVHSKQEFLDSPDAQEQAFDYWDRTTLTPLARKYKNRLPQYTEEELKQIIHFAGEGNLQKAIRDNNFDKPLDGFGSSINSYVRKKQYGGIVSQHKYKFEK